MATAFVGVSSSLLLEPSQTLTFALSATAAERGASACVTLANISAHKPVVFKMRTTNADMFVVTPTQGVLQPGEEVAVVITLVASWCARLAAMRHVERATVVERFLVQSLDRGDDMRGFTTDDLGAFWKRIPKELITNKKMNCQFVDASAQSALLTMLDPPLPMPTPPAPHQQQPVRTQPAREPSSRPAARPRQDADDAHKKAERGNDERYLRRGPRHEPAVVVPPFQTAATGKPEPNQSRQAAVMAQAAAAAAAAPTPAASSQSSPASDAPPPPVAVTARGSAEEDICEYRLQPEDSLTFPVTRTTAGRMDGLSSFFLSNHARQSGLAFKVKTTNHAGYFVKPARGLIAPASAQRVDVFLNAPEAASFDAHQRELQDRFLVEVLFVAPPQYRDLMALTAPEEEEKQKVALQKIWEQAANVDRHKTVMMCAIMQVGPSLEAEMSEMTLDQSQASSLSMGDSRGTDVDRRYPPSFDIDEQSEDDSDDHERIQPQRIQRDEDNSDDEVMFI